MIHTNRRTFLKTSAAASTLPLFNILPGYGEEPKEKLNFAIIGCTNQGGGIGKGAVGTGMVNVVALCDVLPSRADKFKSEHPDAKVYDDFRKMFDEMGDKIDACTIGVPDHAHFPIAMRAIKEAWDPRGLMNPGVLFA